MKHPTPQAYPEPRSDFLIKYSSRYAEFPAFTACPSYQKSYKPEILKKDGLTVNDIREFRYPQNKNAAKYFVNVTHSVTDLIQSITIRVKTPVPNSTETFLNFESSSEFISNLRTYFFRSFGLCYSLEIPFWIQDLKVV